MLGPRIQRRVGPASVAWGAAVLAIGHLLQLMVAMFGNGLAPVVPVLVIEGIGIGMVMAPLVSLALAQVPREHAGVAAGILSTLQSTGNALGVAIIAMLYFAFAQASVLRSIANGSFVLCLLSLSLISVLVAWLAVRLRR
jgi:MFS family permease